MAKLVKREKGDLSVKKKAEKTDEPKIFALPTEKKKPSQKLWDYIFLLFGEKKIGKTSMLAEIDDAFFAMFEPGDKALSTYSHLFTKWSDFRLAVRALKTDKRFSVVVVDTVDLCYKAAEAYALKKLGIEHASEEAYGKGWAAIRKEFTDQIMELVNSGKGVVFISHATEKEIELRRGGKYDVITTTMSGQARDVIEGLVDVWAYYGYDGEDRVLTIVGDDTLSAGHRLGNNFRTPDGKPIRVIDMGKSPADAHKNFMDAFHNRYTPPAKKKTEDDAPKTFKKVKKAK